MNNSEKAGNMNCGVKRGQSSKVKGLQKKIEGKKKRNIYQLYSSVHRELTSESFGPGFKAKQVLKTKLIYIHSSYTVTFVCDPVWLSSFCNYFKST